MENQNNTTQATAPVFTRKTVFRPKAESPAPEVKADSTPIPESEIKEAADDTGVKIVNSENETGTTSPADDHSTTEEWNSFMENLRTYESQGGRENRTNCRLDIDIADALFELDINGSSRPDIVSAVMRGFLLRNKERLSQLRRVNKSFFETI